MRHETRCLRDFPFENFEIKISETIYEEGVCFLALLRLLERENAILVMRNMLLVTGRGDTLSSETD